MLLEEIARHAKRQPNKTAYRNRTQALCYGELWEKANRLAAYLEKEIGPVMIFGEKQVQMPIAFLACMIAGRPYLPIDPKQPQERIEQIQHQAGAKTIICCGEYQSARQMGATEIDSLCQIERKQTKAADNNPNRDVYWLFTSGSSGTPKGVRISMEALENFVRWILSVRAVGDCIEGVTLNQAQFSFDLSVADLWPCFAAGGTVRALEWEEQRDFSSLYAAMRQSAAQRLTCTPSFARFCLCDRQFCRELLPNLKTIFFCGETLNANTVQTLHERFAGLRVINAYGPTEAACAVCAAEIPPGAQQIPVGEIKSAASEILICSQDGKQEQDGTAGEIVIVGESVGNGYVGNLSGGFGERQGKRLYRTGDLGMIRNGLLWYLDRMDRQIKYKGYRIEPGEIEETILSWKEVRAAAVLPVVRQGEVRFLTAVVEWDGEPLPVSVCKERLLRCLPPYMQPKQWKTVEKIPMNERGKRDLHALERMLRNE